MVARIEVTIDEDVVSGDPCAAGTRICVKTNIVKLKAGHTFDRIFTFYPNLPRGLHRGVHHMGKSARHHLASVTVPPLHVADPTRRGDTDAQADFRVIGTAEAELDLQPLTCTDLCQVIAIAPSSRPVRASSGSICTSVPSSISGSSWMASIRR
jgi:hypothetical protein